MPPRRVGPYEILSVIGRGGIGTVYRARHVETGQFAAVKVLGPAPAVDATAARRLAREYEVLCSLDHPNVVRVYGAGVVEGYSFLAMELVDGLDLRAWLSPALDDDAPVCVPLPPGEAARGADPGSDASSEPGSGSATEGAAAIYALAAMMDEPDTEEDQVPSGPHGPLLRDEAPRPPPSPEALAGLNRPARVARLRAALAQVADALAYVHGRGLVHRDLKPTNIMVDDAHRARLMDFGLVKAESDADEELTVRGRIVGTYRYMSPEQAQGYRVDARSDLYSLGVILYELLAGAPPFSTRDAVALWREIKDVAPPPLAALNPGADPALVLLAERLLEKDPARRCQTAVEACAILRGEAGQRVG